MAGLAFVLLAVGCLVAAGLLAVIRNERTPERMKTEQRRVMLAALLNLVPGLGLWLIVRRPKAALINLAVAILGVALVFWTHSKLLHSPWLKDPFSWILPMEFGSVAGAYYAQLRKVGLTEQSILDASRSK